MGNNSKHILRPNYHNKWELIEPNHRLHFQICGPHNTCSYLNMGLGQLIATKIHLHLGATIQTDPNKNINIVAVDFLPTFTLNFILSI